jgi:hypothetical protein
VSPHQPRAAGDLILATRLAVAAYAHRHEQVVRRHCRPIACDVATHALLFDLEEACSLLKPLSRRFRRVELDLTA